MNEKELDKLSEYRELIDKYDRKICKNIVKRIRTVRLIGKYKKENKMKIIDRNREKIVYDKVISLVKGQVNPKVIKKIYKIIIKSAIHEEK